MVKWKILDLVMDGDKINRARYHLTISDDNNSVETEGWIDIQDRTYPEQLEESFVIQYIKEDTMIDGESSIETRAKQQLEALKTFKNGQFPWSKPTFTVNI